MLRTHRSLEGLLCNPVMKIFVFPCNGAPVEWNWHGETEVLGGKPVPVPLCPPLIPHGLTRDRTRASAVRGRRLTAWVDVMLLNERRNSHSFFTRQHMYCHCTEAVLIQSKSLNTRKQAFSIPVATSECLNLTSWTLIYCSLWYWMFKQTGLKSVSYFSLCL
jgi:hypothetical protein